MKGTAAALVLLCISLSRASADSLVTEAKILEVTVRGFKLQVGDRALTAEDTPETRFWYRKKSAKRTSYSAGMSVHVRIKMDSEPPTLREMAEPESWKWLEKVRREPQKCLLKRLDDKYLTVRFEDGTEFRYRFTDKSTVNLTSPLVTKLADLKEGAAIYVKGRLLPNLETWLQQISDRPIEATRSEAPLLGEGNSKSLPDAGALEGRIVAVFAGRNAFELDYDGRKVAFAWTAATRFYRDGKAFASAAMTQGTRCRVLYETSESGRRVALRVDLDTEDAAAGRT